MYTQVPIILKRYWSWKKEKNSRTFIWQKSADVGDFGDRSAASDLGPGQPAELGKPRSFRQAGRLLASRRGGDANTTSSVAGPRHEPDGGSAKTNRHPQPGGCVGPGRLMEWARLRVPAPSVQRPLTECMEVNMEKKPNARKSQKGISPPKTASLSLTQIDLLLTSEHTIFMSHLFVRRSGSGVLLYVDMSKTYYVLRCFFLCVHLPR